MSRLKNAYSSCMECGGSVKMKSGGKWIQGAIKKPGSFTKQAQAAGMSVAGFRNKVLANKGDYSSTTVKRANLAKTLSRMRKAGDGVEVKNKPTESLPDLSGRSSLMENMPSPQMTVRGADPGTRIVQTSKGEKYAAPGTVLPSEINKGLVRGGTEKVAAYQRMLKEKGFNIDVDGAWGPKTQKAYEQYMSSNSAKKAPVSSKSDWGTTEQWDKARERASDGLPSVSLPSSSGIKRKQISSPSKPKLPVSTGTLPSVSLPSSSGIKRRMMMGGSIPGVNGSVIGPAVPMSKTGQSFPKRNAGTSRLSKYKKK